MLAGQLSPDELTAAALCGLTAAFWSAALNYSAPIHFRFPRGTLAAVLRAAGGLFGGTVRVAIALGRVMVWKTASPQLAETIREPFTHGRRLNPADAGRRATAIMARSLAPNSFVIRIPTCRAKAKVHNLLGSSLKKNSLWLI